MPRPTTKSELLAAASASFKKLTTLWDGFTPEQAHAPFPAALLSGGTRHIGSATSAYVTS